MRAIGIPAFGLAIPHVTGLFADVAIGGVVFWIGTAWFLALSAAIWHGNRWLLLEQRRHWDWFEHPVRKIVMLMAAIVLFTAPLTVTMLAGWYAWRGAPVVWSVVQTVVLVNVICVVFVTHVYETVFLIKERADDRVRAAELDRARTRAELDAFLAQVDPHFLFNSLNTLGYLIDTAPARAAEFTAHLAELMRYVLTQRGAELVSLADELAFVDDFVALMQIRFGAAISITVVDEGGDRAARVPPTAIQTLVDNAIKHNEASEERPLAIMIRLRAESVAVENERRPRRTVRASAGVGLRNLDERVHLTSGARVSIDEGGGRFVVRVPLVRDASAGSPDKRVMAETCREERS
ncbi:MAG: sensor histidine kinase [Kofleriaceae bacterium]